MVFNHITCNLSIPRNKEQCDVQRQKRKTDYHHGTGNDWQNLLNTKRIEMSCKEYTKSRCCVVKNNDVRNSTCLWPKLKTTDITLTAFYTKNCHNFFIELFRHHCMKYLHHALSQRTNVKKLQGVALINYNNNSWGSKCIKWQIRATQYSNVFGF